MESPSQDSLDDEVSEEERSRVRTKGSSATPAHKGKGTAAAAAAKEAASSRSPEDSLSYGAATLLKVVDFEEDSQVDDDNEDDVDDARDQDTAKSKGKGRVMGKGRGKEASNTSPTSAAAATSASSKRRPGTPYKSGREPLHVDVDVGDADEEDEEEVEAEEEVNYRKGSLARKTPGSSITQLGKRSRRSTAAGDDDAESGAEKDEEEEKVQGGAKKQRVLRESHKNTIGGNKSKGKGKGSKSSGKSSNNDDRDSDDASDSGSGTGSVASNHVYVGDVYVPLKGLLKTKSPMVTPAAPPSTAGTASPYGTPMGGSAAAASGSSAFSLSLSTGASDSAMNGSGIGSPSTRIGQLADIATSVTSPLRTLFTSPIPTRNSVTSTPGKHVTWSASLTNVKAIPLSTKRIRRSRSVSRTPRAGEEKGVTQAVGSGNDSASSRSAQRLKQQQQQQQNVNQVADSESFSLLPPKERLFIRILSPTEPVRGAVFAPLSIGRPDPASASAAANASASAASAQSQGQVPLSSSTPSSTSLFPSPSPPQSTPASTAAGNGGVFSSFLSSVSSFFTASSSSLSSSSSSSTAPSTVRSPTREDVAPFNPEAPTVTLARFKPRPHPLLDLSGISEGNENDASFVSNAASSARKSSGESAPAAAMRDGDGEDDIDDGDASTVKLALSFDARDMGDEADQEGEEDEESEGTRASGTRQGNSSKGRRRDSAASSSTNRGFLNDSLVEEDDDDADNLNVSHRSMASTAPGTPLPKSKTTLPFKVVMKTPDRGPISSSASSTRVLGSASRSTADTPVSTYSSFSAANANAAALTGGSESRGSRMARRGGDAAGSGATLNTSILNLSGITATPGSVAPQDSTYWERNVDDYSGQWSSASEEDDEETEEEDDFEYDDEDEDEEDEEDDIPATNASTSSSILASLPRFPGISRAHVARMYSQRPVAVAALRPCAWELPYRQILGLSPHYLQGFQTFRKSHMKGNSCIARMLLRFMCHEDDASFWISICSRDTILLTCSFFLPLSPSLLHRRACSAGHPHHRTDISVAVVLRGPGAGLHRHQADQHHRGGRGGHSRGI